MVAGPYGWQGDLLKAIRGVGLMNDHRKRAIDGT
jgi:hypothetical protein